MKIDTSSKIYLVATILSILFFHSNALAISKFASNVRTLDDSTIQLSVWSNAYALPVDLEQMAFKLAAKATVNQGYDYFSLIHNYVSSEKSNARFSSKNEQSTIVFSETKNGKPVDGTITQDLNDLSITFERFLVSTVIKFSNIDSGNSPHFVYRAVDVLRGTAYLEDYFDQSENAVASAVQALRSPEKAAEVEMTAAATASTSVEIQQLLDATNIAFGVKKWQEVVRLSSEIIDQEPSSYLAYSNRSGALAELKELDSALRDANKAIQLNPSHKNSYHNRAYIYALLQDNDSAAIDYKKACELGITLSCEEFKKLSLPTETRMVSIEELHQLSTTAFNQQQWNKVVDLSTKIIEQDVSNFLAYSNRSGAQAELGNLDDALDDVDMALTMNSDYKNAYHNRGYIYTLMNNMQSAIIDYKKACNLGIEQSCKEVELLTVVEAETVIASKAPTVTSLLALTDTAFAQRQWSEVIRLSSEVIEIDNKNYLAYSNRSGALAEEGRLDEALDDANKTLELNADYKFAYHNRGYIYSLLDDDISAIAEYKIACDMGVEQSCKEQQSLAMLADDDIDLQPTPVRATSSVDELLALSDVALANKQWDKVVRLSTEVISQDSNNYLAYSIRSGALAEQGKLKKALLDVNRTLALNDEYKNAYHNRAYIYSLMNNRLSASLDYKKACDLGVSVSCEEVDKLKSLATNTAKNRGVQPYTPNPSVVIIMTQTEDAFNKQQWEEVVRLSSDIIKRDPMNAQAYARRSSALIEQGFLQAALQDINESISLNPDLEKSYYNRGTIYSRLKDNVNASLSYKMACDMGVRASCEAFSKLSSIAGN